MASVILGNTAAIDTKKIDEASDEVERIPLKNGDVRTRFSIPDSYKLSESLAVVVSAYDGYHSDEPPAWVESDSDSLALLIVDHYSTDDHKVEIGQPDDWGE